MHTYRLQLRDTTRHEVIENVCSFVGEDRSGSFGILANHTRFMTSLVFGLARFQVLNQPWQYLALPGGMLYFSNNELVINARRYFRNADYTAISRDLVEVLGTEEQNLSDMKRNLHNIDETILKFLGEFERQSPEL